MGVARAAAARRPRGPRDRGWGNVVTLDQIDAFLAVIKYGNFASAASSLYLTQSALGHRISNLEKELDLELFMRARGVRRVELTEQGSEFVPIAEKMKDLWLEALTLSESAGLHSVRISFVFSLQTILLTPVLVSLSGAGFRPYVMSSNTSGALHMLTSGELDFAVVGNSVPMDDHAYSIDELAEERLVLITNAASGFGDHVAVASLNPSKEIYSRWSTSNESWHQKMFGEGFAPEVSIEDCMQVRSYLEAFPDRWALVPYGIASRFASSGSVRISEPEEQPPAREIRLVSHRPIRVECYRILKDAILATLDQLEGFRLHD